LFLALNPGRLDGDGVLHHRRWAVYQMPFGAGPRVSRRYRGLLAEQRANLRAHTLNAGGRKAVLRGYLGEAHYRIGNGSAHLSNAWYRAAGKRIQAARTRVSNYRNRRDVARGRTSKLEQAAWTARSRVPVYRDRVNPATGRAHEYDGFFAQQRTQHAAELRTRLPQSARRRSR
jgi:hypothetical protein